MKSTGSGGRAGELASEHALLEARGAAQREQLREATEALEWELARVERVVGQVKRAARNPALIALVVAIGVIAMRKGLFRHVRHVPSLLMAINAARHIARRGQSS